MEDIDIWRAAELLRKAYGEDAAIHAAMRADKAFDQGDMGGCEVWKRVVEAIGKLDRKSPKEGDALD